MNSPDPRPQGRYIVPALSQGLAILALFSRERTRITASQISSELNLPRTTVFRMLHTLQAMGLICREADERHLRPGPGLLGAGFSFIASLDFVEVAQPILQRLRDVTNWSAHMAIRDGVDIVYVARCATNSTVRSSVSIGVRRPLHATIMGRALSWEIGKAELETLYEDKPLQPFSEQTPTTTGDFEKLVAADRARGYACSQSYFEHGVSAVATPVRDAFGLIAASINLTSVDADVDPGYMHGPIKDALLAAAQEINLCLANDSSLDEDGAPAGNA